MSTASSTSIEDAALASGPTSPRWFQLYWPHSQHNDITLSLLTRARSSGFSVLIVTLDTDILGWRPSDLDTGYNPFLLPDPTGVAIGLSDPVFKQAWAEAHGGADPGAEDQLAESSPAWVHTVFSGVSHSWADLAFLRKHWDGPIVLKGIQTVGDARRAVEAGMDGIVVSNHGGRQVDGSVASLDCLPPIVKAVGERIEVMYDSGVRCGADVVKALALGAKVSFLSSIFYLIPYDSRPIRKLVFIGRPYIYGLAMGGQAGVKHVLGAFLADIDLTMELSGIESVQQLGTEEGREFVRRIGV